jgi:hypothetical protein
MSPTVVESSALAPVFICQICRQALQLTGVPIIGEKELERLARIQNLLFAHLSEHHKKEFAESMMMGQSFGGWLSNEYFKHSEPRMNRESENFRKLVREKTKRVRVTDETIARQVETFLTDAILSDPEKARKSTVELIRKLVAVLDEVPPKQEQAAR